MKDKFTEVYLNIITEAWDRYEYLDIINSVKAITNNGKDPWIKEETGKKIFQYLKENGALNRGGELIQASNLHDENASGAASYVKIYWNGRKQSGNPFDIETANLINYIDDGFNRRRI